MAGLMDRWIRVNDYIVNDLGGGPRPWKLAWIINAQKGGTLPFVLLMMAIYGNFSATAWTYAALHGSYGVAWVIKDLTFGDPGWQKRVTVGSGLAAFMAVLGPYWLAPWLLVSRDVNQPPWMLGLASFVYAVGLVLMIGSDAQKHYTLSVKRGLITTGFFSRVRHPNYLGEMMIYGSFAALAGHWIPWAVLAWVWGGIFSANIARKERSMSRYPEWADYVARTGLLLPRLR